MRAVQVPNPGSRFDVVDRQVPRPNRGEVLVRVAACGVCHTDAVVMGGLATAYPRVPGHEVAGRVETLGEGVTQWQAGQRVGSAGSAAPVSPARPAVRVTSPPVGRVG
jgi:D-arabinose 1-dehydrogenase-like Zn-dependent alcohol dehydrogenase